VPSACGFRWELDTSAPTTRPLRRDILILELGYVLPGDILNVNAFLNHQLDTELLVQIGKTFAGHFSNLGVTKIITIETSGIAAAVTTGIELQVPVVFARTIPTPTIWKRLLESLRLFLYQAAAARSDRCQGICPSGRPNANCG
jgi:hypothetical protein